MERIAIYGKGGIGKSTTVTNLSAALVQKGLTVMQIGCDPKSDSTINLTGGKRIPTVLEVIRDKDKETRLEDLVSIGSGGVLCVEAGGPKPGIGCAGRGIIAAFEKLAELKAYDVYKPDVVIYDVLGDVVCGGFAMPIRNGYADSVCIVTSGESMSLYAADNIASAVRSFGVRGYAGLKGLILNKKGIVNEVAIVEQAAREIDTAILHTIERDPLVQEAEAAIKRCLKPFPKSDQARSYQVLADKLFDVKKPSGGPYAFKAAVRD